MIVFRCLLCYLGNLSDEVRVLICPHCGGELFEAQYRTSFEPELHLQTMAETVNFSAEPTKPTTERKSEVIGSCASLIKQTESTGNYFMYYENSAYGIGRSDVECRGSEDADKINFYASNNRLGQEQPSQNGSQDLIVKERILTEIQNTFGHIYGLNAQGKDKFNPSSFNLFPNPVCALNAELKNPVIFSDPPSSTQCQSQSFPEMPTEKQKTTNSSRIQNVGGEMSFACSSHFESHTSMLQSYPESGITKSKLKSTGDQGNNSSPAFLNKPGNSSNKGTKSEDLRIVNKVAHQEAHFSDQQTRVEGPEKASAFLEKSSSASTSTEFFKCGCSLKDLPIEVSRCPRCGKENFVAECMPLSHPVTQLPPIARSINFSHESTKAKRQVIGSSPAVYEQNESTRKDVTFSYEDSRLGIKRTDVESHETKDDIGTSFSGSNIHLKQEQPLQHFSQDPIQQKQFLPENQNACGDAHSLPVSDSYSLNPSTVNFLPDLTRAPFAEPQQLINFSHEPSSAECESQYFTEMTINKQKTTDSSRIQKEDGNTSFAGSSHFEPHASRLQHYSESASAKSSLRVTGYRGNNSSPELLSEIGNSFTRNFPSIDFKIVNESPQHGILFSKKPKSMDVTENTLKEPSTPPSKKVFRCRKCSSYFRSESKLNAHVLNNCKPNPFKCDQCPAEFEYESYMTLHQRVHFKEKPFKCDQCNYAGKWKRYVTKHKENCHGANALPYNGNDGK